MATIQGVGTEQEGETAVAGRPQVLTSSNGDVVALVSDMVAEYDGADRVLLSTDAMRVGEPYIVRIGGVPVIALRRPDESVDFYGIP